MIIPITAGFILGMLILGVGLGKVIIDTVGPVVIAVLVIAGIIIGIILLRKLMEWIYDMM